MSTCELAPSAARVTTQPAFATRMIGGIVALVRAWKNRSAFNRLSEMSEAELADIGLTRGDLHAAIDKAFASDPTAKLRSLANQRAATAAQLARTVG